MPTQTPSKSADSTSRFKKEQFETSYPDGVQDHYWTVARHRILARAIRHAHKTKETVLDIGCGRGITVDYLRSKGFNIVGCELADPRPIVPGVAPHLFLGTSAFELPDDLTQRVTTILLLDVLEHLEDPSGFLESCLSRFSKCRHVLVTVPARMELWSNYDTYYGHFLRYNRPRLQALCPTGWKVLRCGYFFHGLYLPGLLLKLLRRPRSLVMPPPSDSSCALHAFIGLCFDLEQRVLPSILPGSSLLMVMESQPEIPIRPGSCTSPVS